MSMNDWQVAKQIQCNGAPISDKWIEMEGHHVKELFLSQCGLEKIPDQICHLSHLENLDLDHNRIRKIEGVDPVSNPELDSINLDGNAIRKIEGLEGLHLSFLHLDDNKILKIEGLANQPLVALDLANNKIRKIEGLDNLRGSIESLVLRDNVITDPAGIPAAFQYSLLNLDLAGNPIPRGKCDRLWEQWKDASYLENLACGDRKWNRNLGTGGTSAGRRHSWEITDIP